ncbi:MAG TPA: helix-turn-helix transcriptional regulator [Azospirillum sp.]
MTDMDPRQIRAARALVGWSRDELAAAIGMAVRTLARLELGETPYPRVATITAIRTALEGAGVEFLAAGESAGPGVRLRKVG